MIIWSGLGILIPIIAIIGIVVGTVISSILGHPAIGPGFGLVLAAAGNWGLWKLVYPKQPKVMLDTTTGQQVVVKPSHGLFFIPAKIWTWLLGILAVPVLVLGAATDKSSAENAAKPGYKEFEAANGLIASKSKGSIHGSNDAAKQAASAFSENMKTISETAFTTCRACACTWLIAAPAFCACSTPAATRSTPCFMLATAVAVPD